MNHHEGKIRPNSITLPKTSPPIHGCPLNGLVK